MMIPVCFLCCFYWFPINSDENINRGLFWSGNNLMWSCSVFGGHWRTHGLPVRSNAALVAKAFSRVKSSNSDEKLDSLCWFSQRHTNATFLGCTPRGLWPPNSNSAKIFVQFTYLPFHHPMFTHLEVIMLTNTQTDAAENVQQSSLCYDVG